MTTNQNYISDEGLDDLDDFLLERIAENADTEGKDEGILCLSELDGFKALRDQSFNSLPAAIYFRLYY